MKNNSLKNNPWWEINQSRKYPKVKKTLQQDEFLEKIPFYSLFFSVGYYLPWAIF